MGSGISRRKLLQVAGTAGVAASLGVGRRSYGQGRNQLRILQWNHFVPGYDKWFNGTYVKQWGEKNDTEVTVDNVGIPALNPTAASEVSAKKGHDLYGFLSPRPVYENDVIDHREIYEECEKKYGKPIDLAIKSTFNPRTKKYHGFSDSFAPDPINYRKDLWDEIGMKPDSWDDVRVGGAKIKAKTGLGDSLEWVANVGYPGYATAAIDDAYSTWVLNTMFASAATGAVTPEDAVKDAEAKYRKIWEKWKERKLI